jgi:hypothetical protein
MRATSSARMFAIFPRLAQCLGMLGAGFGSKPVQVSIRSARAQRVWLWFAVVGFVQAAIASEGLCWYRPHLVRWWGHLLLDNGGPISMADATDAPGVAVRPNSSAP